MQRSKMMTIPPPLPQHCIMSMTITFLVSLPLHSSPPVTFGVVVGLRPPMMSASGRTSRVQTEEARDGSLSVGLGCLLPCISPPFFLRSPAHGQKILCLMWQRSLEAAKAAAYMYRATCSGLWLMPCLKTPPSGEWHSSKGHREQRESQGMSICYPKIACVSFDWFQSPLVVHVLIASFCARSPGCSKLKCWLRARIVPSPPYLCLVSVKTCSIQDSRIRTHPGACKGIGTTLTRET